MHIKHWPSGEQPREKLIHKGSHALSDAELLAIFLRTGTRGKSAVALARELLSHFGSLQGVFQASLDDIAKINGLGPAKYAQLQAIMALAERYFGESLQGRDVLNNTAATSQYIRSKLVGLEYEVFLCLCLNTQNELISCTEIARGTHNEARVYPREVVKLAIKANAAGVIFAHNHPSGCCRASNADIVLTQALQNALATVDIDVYDHILVAGQSAISFASKGWLP